jgi:hypothetical protein
MNTQLQSTNILPTLQSRQNVKIKIKEKRERAYVNIMEETEIPIPGK